MLPFPLILLLVPVASETQQVEIGFIISGADDFGGHSLQIYHDEIKQIVEELVLGLNIKTQQKAMQSKFGLVWTYPKLKPQYKVAVELSFVDTFRRQLTEWLSKPHRTRLSETAGLQGALEFTRDKLFSDKKGAIQIVIALTQQEILGSEIVYFLVDKCPPVTSAIIFPKSDGCDNNQLQNRLQMFRKHFHPKYKGELAVCSRDTYNVERLSHTLMSNFEASKQVAQLCEQSDDLQISDSEFAGANQQQPGETAGCAHWSCSSVFWLTVTCLILIVAILAVSLAVYHNYLAQKRREQMQMPQVATIRRNNSNSDPRRENLLSDLRSSTSPMCSFDDGSGPQSPLSGLQPLQHDFSIPSFNLLNVKDDSSADRRQSMMPNTSRWYLGGSLDSDNGAPQPTKEERRRVNTEKNLQLLDVGNLHAKAESKSFPRTPSPTVQNRRLTGGSRKRRKSIHY